MPKSLPRFLLGGHLAVALLAGGTGWLVFDDRAVAIWWASSAAVLIALCALLTWMTLLREHRRDTADAASREASEHLAAFFRSSPAAHSIYDLDTRKLVDVNDAWVRMFGHPRDEALAHEDGTTAGWVDEETRRYIDAEVSRNGSVRDLHGVRRRKDGGEFEVLCSAERIEVGGRRYRVTSLLDVSEQLKARRALERSEARFQTFFRANPAAMMITRVSEGVCVDANVAYERLMKFAPGEPLGMTAAQRGAWPDRAVRGDMVARAMRDGRARTRTKMRRRDTTWFDALITMEPIDLEGEAHLLTAIIDTSIEARALEALERIAAFFRLSPIGFVITRLADGRYVEVNEAYERITGYARAELIDRTVQEMHRFDDAERSKFLAAVREHGSVRNFPNTAMNKSGETVHESLSADRIDLDGEPHLLTAVVDVTLQEQARQAILRTEALFARYFRSNPEAQAISEVESGRFREVNDAWMRMLGHKRDEAVGRTAADLGTRVDPGARAELIARVQEHGRIENVPLRMRRKSGEEFDAVHSAELIELGAERLVLTSLRDVSLELAERRTLEDRVRERTAALEVSNRELESFSYSVSHDMRAPIRSIASYSEIMRSSYAELLPPDALQMLGRIERAGRHLGDLVDALLDLSRLMRTSFERRDVDLTALAEKVIEAHRERDSGRTIECVVQSGLVANADSVLAASLLDNLIGNAWKYTEKTAAPRIEVGCAADEFFVRDNGVGFDMNYANKLFKPFERLHRVGEYPGTGIGLATVERIVRRHGGTVRAESKPGLGATFYFTLRE